MTMGDILYLTVIFFLLLVILTGVAVWPRLLRRQVAKQTAQLEKELAQRKRDFASADWKIEKMASFFDESPNPFLRIFFDGTIIYHNKASSALPGVTRARAQVSQSGPWSNYIAQALHSGRPQHGEIRSGNQIFSLTFAPLVHAGYVDVHGLDITEHERIAEQSQRQSAQLRAINEVFQKALSCESEKDVAQTCLAVAEKLTHSKFGYIGELNEAGMFDTLAISNPGWDDRHVQNSEATKTIKNMPLRGLDRSTVREGQSRIVNNPASHPDRVGTPNGHPPITCFLGVPLKQAGTTMGMIALANRESGYEQADQEAIEALSVALVEALMRKRAEKKAQARYGQPR